MKCQLSASRAARSSGEVLKPMAQELAPFGRHDHEPDQSVVGGNAGMAAEDDIAEHRRPLDLEQERGAAPDMPDAVHVLEVLRTRAW